MGIWPHLECASIEEAAPDDCQTTIPIFSILVILFRSEYTGSECIACLWAKFSIRLTPVQDGPSYICGREFYKLYAY